MKISFCSVAFKEEKITDIIPRIASLGYDGIEIIGHHIDGKSDDELCDIKFLAEDNGISIEVLSPYFWFTNSEELYEKSLQIAERFVHYCHILGANKIRTFTDSGPTGIGSDIAAEEHWNRAVKALKYITAFDRNIFFVVETHKWTLADTPGTTIQLINKVDALNLKVNYQPKLGRELEDYELLKEHVRHIHLQNFKPDGSHTFLEDGVLNVAGLMSVLESAGYNDFVSVEYCWSGVTWDRAEKAIEYLNSCLP